MRKYFYLFKSEVMSSLQYIVSVFVNFIVFFLLIFVFLCLWQYMYADPEELINGYSMHQMMWYLIATESLYTVVGGRKFCRKIAEDVKGGNISYNLNKPYSYIEYRLFSHLGEILVKGLVFLSGAIILGAVFTGQLPHLSLGEVLAVAVSFVLSYIISTIVMIVLGLFSFFIEDSSPLYWLYSKFILVFGTIFPIEFFPVIVQPLLRYSLIYVVSYGPANLLVDFGWEKFLNVTIAQIIYIGIVYGLATLIYRKGVKKLNVNGG